MEEGTGTVQVQEHLATQTRRATSRRRSLNLGLWALQVLLALQFVAGGFLKLSGNPAMVDMFAAIGAGQWLRYVVGALEVAGAVSLLIPRLSGLAALGLVGLMLGAAATNTFILNTNPWLPVGFLVVSAPDRLGPPAASQSPPRQAAQPLNRIC